MDFFGAVACDAMVIPTVLDFAVVETCETQTCCDSFGIVHGFLDIFVHNVIGVATFVADIKQIEVVEVEHSRVGIRPFYKLDFEFAVGNIYGN